MKHLMMGLILVALTLFGDPDAWAETVTISYQMPTQYCTGAPLPLADITDLEIYVSESTIPAAGALMSCGQTVDDPPSGPGVVVTPADPTLNQLDLDVAPGLTYFFRARVRVASGEWSNLSNEVQRFVSLPRPGVPTITIITI